MTSPPSGLPRRAFTTGLGGVGLAALAPFGSIRADAATPPSAWAQRAWASYQALQKYLYLPESRLYRENHPTLEGENPYSYVWPLREATAATQDVDRLKLPGGHLRDDVPRRFRALARYWDAERGAYDSYPPPPLGTRGDPFFDDNTIIGLEFLRRFRLARDREMLRLAERVFAYVTTAWDTGTTGPCPGGMHWVDASWNPYQGATNVTSLASELAAHLHEETGKKHYLDWATRTYDWVRKCMRRGDGLYANGLRFDGVTEETLWTYNSGSMIGAATLHHRATGSTSSLKSAVEDAEGAMSYWSADDRLYGQPAIFNAILFANLLLLQSEAKSQDYRDIMTRYAERVWRENRDADTGLFRFQGGGGGAPDPNLRPQTLHQSAATQIFALLAWTTRDYEHAT